MDFLTLGSAMIDHTFYAPDAVLIDRPNDALRQRLVGFEYGAKLVSEEVYSTLGGGGCNTAVGLRRLGWNVASRVCVGSDDEGAQIVKRLQEQGVETRWVEVKRNERSGMSFLVVEPKQHEHVVFLSQGANRWLQCPTTLLRSLRPRVVYVAPLRVNQWKTLLNAVVAAKKNLGVAWAWNPGTDQLAASAKTLSPLLRQADVLIVNEDEATELLLRFSGRVSSRSATPAAVRLKALAEKISAWGPKTVVVTAGKDGAAVAYAGSVWFQRAIKVRAKDTTGAGDCFGSTFVGLRLRGWEVDRALAGAAINAASLVQEVGAERGLLTFAQIEQRVRSSSR